MFHLCPIAKSRLTVAAFFLLVSFQSGCNSLPLPPAGPDLTEVRPLRAGKDSFVARAYKHSGRKTIRVWAYKPAGWSDGDSVLFVMHGMGRNAEDYLDAWVEIADRKNLLLLAPEFRNRFFRYTTKDYQEGNLESCFLGLDQPEGEWVYSVIENIFDHVVRNNQLTVDGYNVFGHSAGGQVVHRMVLLKPGARIKKAVAANAGFYTFPDTSIRYPYGLKGVESRLQESFALDLTVLLGELDNNAGQGRLRQTKEARAQGVHRLERGRTFFHTAREKALRDQVEFNWRIQVVPGVGHDYKKMSQAAADLF